MRYGLGIEEKSPSLDDGQSQGNYFDEFPAHLSNYFGIVNLNLPSFVIRYSLDL